MIKAFHTTIKATLLLLAIFTFCSCSKPKDLTYGTISDVSVKNMSLSGVDVEATIPVENLNGYDITVQDAQMDLLANDKVLAHLTQLYPVVIAGKSKHDYKVGASIKLANAGALMTLMSLANGDNANLTLDGTLKAKAVVISKTVKVHQTNIQDYLKPVVDKLHLF